MKDWEYIFRRYLEHNLILLEKHSNLIATIVSKKKIEYFPIKLSAAKLLVCRKHLFYLAASQFSIQKYSIFFLLRSPQSFTHHDDQCVSLGICIEGRKCH
jgi:Tfp pilus assembly protein PilE